MNLTRRALIKNGALAVVGTAAIPQFLTRAVMAQPTDAGVRRKKLVVIFQRGAADGLNIVVPYAEPSYYQMRPTIAIPQKQVLTLDDRFGLHPAMATLRPLWDQKQLAIVHAVGSPDSTRSHFDAQDYMESGTPGVKSTQDGWLNRALQAEDEARRRGSSPFRAVALTAQMPRSLEGSVPAIAMTDLAQFSVGGRDPRAASVSDVFRTMYDQSSDTVLHGEGHETFEALKMMKSLDPAKYKASPAADYPQGKFGDALKLLAQLMKADCGVEAAFCDIGGWDTHQNQGAVEGQLSERLKELSRGVSAFWTDMGTASEDVLVVTMSEFGRTARQNGTAGTDHGHGNVMFLLGGEVKGGNVYGSWPGLAPEQLNEGRDLKITTDFRRVLAEASYQQLGAHDLALTFPQARLSSSDFLNYL